MIAAFGVTTLLGAFLLFEVQPLVSKAILPWFGGVPAVWTTCMLFFQVLLLAGYVYAHLLQRWFSPRNQATVHLAVVIVAAMVLPILPGAAWRPPDGSNPAWQILLLLAGTVGLPYFALSATSPLVQTWFSGSLPGRSPYRLYALSNFGSLVALLSYPLVIEPALDLPRQSSTWTAGFLLYGVFCLAALACVWRLGWREPEDLAIQDALSGHATQSARSDVAGPADLARPAGLGVTDAVGLDEPRLSRRGGRAAALGRSPGALLAVVHYLLRSCPLVRPSGLGHGGRARPARGGIHRLFQ